MPVPDEGHYLVSAEAYDGRRPVLSEIEAVVVHRWAAAETSASKAADDDGLPLIVLPKRGRVGETIAVKVRAPKRARAGLLAFIRGEVQDAVPLRFERGAAVAQVRIRDAWFPQVSVHAAVMLPGGQGRGQKVDPKAELLSASSSLQVAGDHRNLAVAVKGPASSGPGSQVTYRVSVRDHVGRPLPSAHISAWAVDEGLLALQDYQVPSLVDAFAFVPVQNTVEIDSFARLIAPFLKAELDELGGGVGGVGRGAGGLGGRRVRRPNIDSSCHARSRFETTPFFLGDVAVDAHGEATIGFHLPDNLTRFRVTVVAAAPLTAAEGPYLRFGQQEISLQVSQPLSLRPLLPKFLRPGDRSEASAVVVNQGTAAGTVEVSLAVEATPGEKAPVSPVSIDGAGRRTLTLAGGQERRVSFPIRATAEGQAQLLVTARLGHDQRFRDAVRLPLGVQSEPVPLDRIAMSGTLSGGANEEIRVRLPADAARAGTAGTWRLRLGRGLESDLDGAIGYLASYRYACAEQLASTLLPLLLYPKHPLLAARGELDARVKARIDHLLKLKVESQRAEDEGGIDFWPGSRRPSLFPTAWALLVLSHAPAEVDTKGQVGSLAAATAHMLTKPAPDRRWSAAVRALGFLALARAKQKLTDVPSPAPAYDPITTGFSALALVLGAGNDPVARGRATATARHWLSEAILRLPEDPRTLHAPSSAIAHDMPARGAEVAELVLAWALANLWPDHPAHPKLARALVTHRRASQFANTFENALFLMVAADAGGASYSTRRLSITSPKLPPKNGSAHRRRRSTMTSLVVPGGKAKVCSIRSPKL